MRNAILVMRIFYLIFLLPLFVNSYDRMRREMAHAQNLVKASSKLRKSAKENGYLIESNVLKLMSLQVIYMFSKWSS